MPAKVKIDKKAVWQLVAESSSYAAAMNQLGQREVDYAKSIAPVLTGAYRAGLQYQIRMVSRMTHKVPAVRIKGVDFKTRWVEFGTKHSRRQAKHVLARTLRDIGSG